MRTKQQDTPGTLELFGFTLHRLDLEEATERVLAATAAAGAPQETGPLHVVTLNPEIVVRSREDAELYAAVKRAQLTVADGIGIVWAARRAGVVLPGRVPGVELSQLALARGGGALNVYFLGGRPGVAQRAAAQAREQWGIRVAGVHDGYFGSEQEEQVVEQISASRPDLLLAALGERQELFLDRNRNRLNARVMIGVGGTLDVLAGEVERTPEWTRRYNLEWAYRVGLDRKRWHRFPRLLKFAALVLRNDLAGPPGQPAPGSRIAR